MFSATFPREMQILAGDFLHNYLFLTVGRVGAASQNITQKLILADDCDKFNELLKILEENPKSRTLVFVQTKRGADVLDNQLRQRRFEVTSIHGDLKQWEREEALRDFKTGARRHHPSSLYYFSGSDRHVVRDNPAHLLVFLLSKTGPILVATDVAARGLDINDVARVVNYDLPTHIDDYVHRIGRTGRAGNTGTAISFFNRNNANIARELQKVLLENFQETPEWLSHYNNLPRSSGKGRSGGGSGSGGGGPGFASRDYRAFAE